MAKNAEKTVKKASVPRTNFDPIVIEVGEVPEYRRRYKYPIRDMTVVKRNEEGKLVGPSFFVPTKNVNLSQFAKQVEGSKWAKTPATKDGTPNGEPGLRIYRIA